MKNIEQRQRWPRLCLRLLTAALASSVVFLAVAPAHARGRVVWKETTIDENTKRESWKLKLEIHLNSPPDVAYLPMKFEFEPKALYERSLVDGREEPLERTIPLQNHQAIIESVDVGFLDAGSGEIQSRTRFSFKITRAHDFEAGEYRVTIKDARNGQRVGTPVTLRLKGENPVIDRRSVVFHGKGDKKKAKASEEASESEQAESTPEEEPTPELTEPAPAPEPEDEGQVPPSVEEKPGGGCHHGPPHNDSFGWVLVALLGALGAVAWRRTP